ncbi:translation elongation factor Ts [Candidatus Falkowbacteria bacterium RBG_13_39_14]|uniref:Elongation factor Ts n=1 Tax=Candidatus Falkowbacteria bacterium RBG_13_39_14 TaxID=1797985 RepID=A0A1F5S669_9BACT|nr:MAG: translation elongation factor Ts [Candidatus Falkowbacteria bacterium RBG_13_39_14]
MDAQTIVRLRDMTGAGMLDCKKALDETGGDIEKAVDYLRKKGEVKAAKKSAERTASEGIIHAYIHAGGKVGVMLQLSCETDFVARNEEFKALAHDIAMHIAASNPTYVKQEDVPENELKKEKEIYRERLKAEGKPDNIIDKIMAGKISKYFEEVCLLKQPFIKDDKKKVEQIITEAVAKIGEKIEVVRFARYQI